MMSHSTSRSAMPRPRRSPRFALALACAVVVGCASVPQPPHVDEKPTAQSACQAPSSQQTAQQKADCAKQAGTKQ